VHRIIESHFDPHDNNNNNDEGEYNNNNTNVAIIRCLYTVKM
jgi:hypothetical protein